MLGMGRPGSDRSIILVVLTMAAIDKTQCFDTTPTTTTVANGTVRKSSTETTATYFNFAGFRSLIDEKIYSPSEK